MWHTSSLYSSASSLSTAKSVSGDVRIESIRSDDTLTVGSVSGDVFADGLNVRRLEVETVSAEIELRDVTCDRVDVSTVSGDLDYPASAVPQRPLRSAVALGRSHSLAERRRRVRDHGRDLQRRDRH